MSFLIDVAEFETAYARYLKRRNNELRLKNDPRYSPGLDPNIWQKRSRMERQGIPLDNLGNPVDNGFTLSEKQIRRNIDSGTRELYNRDDLFQLPDNAMSRKTKTGYTKRRYDGDSLNIKGDKQSRIDNLSPENRAKIYEKRFPKQENPWDAPNLPSKQNTKTITTQTTTPKPQLLLAPAKEVSTTPLKPKTNTANNIASPKINTANNIASPKIKPSRKFLNKYSLGALGAAGVLGGGYLGYRAYQNKQKDKNRFAR